MNINNVLGNNKVQWKMIFGAIILVITLAFVGFAIQGSLAKPPYSFTSNDFIISGQYGVTIHLLGATVTHELNQVPTAETKTNGAAIGKIKKGYFKISGSEVYFNIMDENASNYILITDKNGSKYYINSASSEETTNLYNKIAAKNSSQK